MERRTTDGKPEYGIFEESVGHINHRDFDLRAPAGRLARYVDGAAGLAEEQYAKW